MQGVSALIFCGYSELEKIRRKVMDSPDPLRLAVGVTCIVIGITLFAAIQNPIVAVPQIVFLVVLVVQMWKRKAWAAYGGAAVLFASTLATLAMVAAQNRPLR